MPTISTFYGIKVAMYFMTPHIFTLNMLNIPSLLILKEMKLLWGVSPEKA